MRSEHLSNLHVGWTLTGWVVAVAVTSVVHLALTGAGLLTPAGPGEVLGSVAALAVGFFAGGAFVGLRWSDAPVLHGVAIALVSVVVAALGSLVAPEPMSAVTVSSILVQLAAAVAGALFGRSLVLRGRTPDPAAIPPEA